MWSYQNLPYTVYLQRNSAEYVHSVQSLTGQFQAVVQQLLLTFSNGLVALVILGLLLWENATALGLLVALVGSTLFIYDRFFRRRMRSLRATPESRRRGDGAKASTRAWRAQGDPHPWSRGTLPPDAQTGCRGVVFQPKTQSSDPAITRYLLEAVLVIFVVLLGPAHAFYLKTAAEDLLGTLGLFGVAAIRLMPMANQLAATLTNLRFQPGCGLSLVCRRPATQCPGINHQTAIQYRYFTFSEIATEGRWLSLSEHKARRTA